MTRTPPSTLVRARAARSGRWIAVRLGRSSNWRSLAYSSRISVGERTSNRAGPSRTTAAGAGAASASVVSGAASAPMYLRAAMAGTLPPQRA
jgi:hypothetical protein